MSGLHDFLTGARAFICVYRLPERLTDGYCFGGGKPIPFLNVDWFEAPIAEGREPLIQFIKTKQYYSSEARFLVLGDHPNFIFTIEPIRKVVRFDPT